MIKRATLIAGTLLLLLLFVQPAAAAPAKWAILGHHVVQPGETLYCIGRAYGVDPFAIAAQNGIINPSFIVAGTTLAIPAAYAALPAGPVCTRQFDGCPPSSECTCASYYTINRGDTLFGISRRFNVNMFRIADCNHILNLNFIRTGDTLCIPAP